MRRSCLALFSVLWLTACPGGAGTDTTETGTETGDGDGDGDGDPTTGDGDGDPAMGDGDGDETDGDLCGDGVINGDEECDNGPNNADSAACTSMCTLATCGDGLVYLDNEDCDDGGESATCDDDCTPAACGDGNVNGTAGEACEGDGMVNNGLCMSCDLQCAPNYENCNGIGDDGCEIYLCEGGTCENPQLQPGSIEFNYTGSIETWEVPACVEMVTIEAFGASGGGGTNLAYPGGLGARMRGDFEVEDGETFAILVGGEGAPAADATEQGGGSGGGGTFVARPPMNNPTPVIVAGGGGGASVVNMQGELSAPGGDGQTTQVGQSGEGDQSGAGGSDGNGGGSCSWGGWHGGTGGGGFLTAGTGPSMGSGSFGTPNEPGRAFANGGQGGMGGSEGRDGGFGGGGSAGFTGGGGGGYSGGGAGGINGELNSGGGGGSINLGGNQDNSAGNNVGDGRVTISW